jgi:putative transcriptional regulator
MSEILDIAHEMAQDLFNVGAMDDVTMFKVEELCYGGNEDD